MTKKKIIKEEPKPSDKDPLIKSDPDPVMDQDSHDTSSKNDDTSVVLPDKDKEKFVELLSSLDPQQRSELFRLASGENADEDPFAAYDEYRANQGFDTLADMEFGPQGSSLFAQEDHGDGASVGGDVIGSGLGGNLGLGLGGNAPVHGRGGTSGQNLHGSTAYGGSLGSGSLGSGGSRSGGARISGASSGMGSGGSSNSKPASTGGNNSNKAGVIGQGRNSSGVTRKPNILVSGLQVRPSGRSAFEISKTEVQISKYGRGRTPQERLKTRKLVVRTLSPKLAMSDITKLTNTAEVDNYDISKDAHMQEHALLAISKYAQTFDMAAIFMIPNHFTLHDSLSPQQASSMTNLLDHWKEVDEVDVFAWQEFILRYGSAEDLESNNWMEETLYLSMEQSLKADVLSEMQDVAHHQRGAVSLFFVAVKRVCMRNQEARDLLQTWIKEFSILNFANQDVSKACTAFKAVVRSIGEKDLPDNTVRCLLGGMAHATNPSFKQVCATNEAMLSSSLYQRQLGTVTIMEHVKSVMNDLEIKYLALVGGKKWDGVGHEPVAFLADKDALKTEYDGQARALAARGEKILPFNEWVKTANCHYCGEQGHITPHCPKYLKEKKSEWRGGRRGSRTPLKDNKRWSSSKGSSERRGKKERAFRKEMKALLTKYAADDSSDDDDSESEAGNEDEASVESNKSEQEQDEEAPSANFAGLYLNE